MERPGARLPTEESVLNSFDVFVGTRGVRGWSIWLILTGRLLATRRQ